MNDEKELYEHLMQEQQKSRSDFYCWKLSDNVLLFKNNNRNNKQMFFVNTSTKKVYELISINGNLRTFMEKDIDFDLINSLENSHDARRLLANYYFGIYDFKDGVAMVQWTLYPDGQYFADEDGYGAEDNEEVNVYAFIDENSNILIPFTPMTQEQQDIFHEQAVNMVNMKK
ncbi:MAG: hypothetical protein ACK5MK_05740 [Dysgonomonas sp.]